MNQDRKKSLYSIQYMDPSSPKISIGHHPPILVISYHFLPPPSKSFLVFPSIFYLELAISSVAKYTTDKLKGKDACEEKEPTDDKLCS